MKIKHSIYLSLAYVTTLSAQTKQVDPMDMALYFPVPIATDITKEPNRSQFYDYIVNYEHAYGIPYKDGRGYWHAGIGHLLTYKGGELNYLGQPKQKEYSVSEMTKWFREDLEIALKAAKKQFKSFDSQPYEIKLLLTDMVFNLGNSGISQFIKFTKAIENHNYPLAAAEIANSKYAKQVGIRAKDHIAILQSFAK